MSKIIHSDMYAPPEFYPAEAWPNGMPAAQIALLSSPDAQQHAAAAAAQMQHPIIPAHLMPEGMQFAPFPFDPHQHELIMPPHIDPSQQAEWQLVGSVAPTQKPQAERPFFRRSLGPLHS